MKAHNSSRTRARVLLLFTVLVWGTSFVVVKSALADASPLLFNFVRMALASAVLVATNFSALHSMTRRDLLSGAVAGVFLAAGYQLQTLGLVRTTAAKSAFTTGLVVVLVPLLAMLPGLRSTAARTPQWLAIVGATLAFSGLVLLTTPAGTPFGGLFSSVDGGDLLTVGCAFAFALHLLWLARVSGRMHAGVLATVQIATAALLMLLTLPLEPVHHFALTLRLCLALAVTSVFGTAAAFTIQSYAQQHLEASETAVLLTLEPVFATLTSVLVLGEVLTGRALAGAGLILLSLLLVELLPGRFVTLEIPA